MRRRLAPLKGHPNVADIRQCGLMVGIEMACSLQRAWSVASSVCQTAIARGLMLRPLGEVVVLMPAPAMDIATLDRMMDIVVEALANVE